MMPWSVFANVIYLLSISINSFNQPVRKGLWMISYQVVSCQDFICDSIYTVAVSSKSLNATWQLFLSKTLSSGEAVSFRREGRKKEHWRGKGESPLFDHKKYSSGRNKEKKVWFFFFFFWFWKYTLYSPTFLQGSLRVVYSKIAALWCSSQQFKTLMQNTDKSCLGE